MPNDDGENNGGTDSGGDGFRPITSQDDLNRIIGERVARTKAQYADYDVLKEKAGRLDTIEAANKTEAEKSADRIAALEKQLADTQATALRSRIQAKHGISDEDAALFLTAPDEATLTKQAQALAERAADRRKTGNRDPFAGRTPSKTGIDPMRDFTRGLFGRDD